MDDKEKIEYLYSTLAMASIWAKSWELKYEEEVPWLLLAEQVLQMVGEDHVKRA